MTTLQQAIAKKKREEAMKGGDVFALINQVAEDLFQKFLEEQKSVFVSKISEAIQIKVDEIQKEVKNGEDGENGETPSDAHLIDLMLPLIPPKAKDGHTPTKDEILEIIKPYLPEDGKTPEIDYMQIAEKAVSIIISNDLMPENEGQEETGIELANKINAETTPVLNISSIINLEKILQEINRLITTIRTQTKQKGGGAPGGGGMGNAVPQTFNVSSATTTITTSDRIAANGKALWAYYEGAWLVPGTGFTVGSDRKTITLLFTPEDGTHIDILLIRG